MRFLSVCSGMEAASVAWEPLGWKAIAFSEIEKYPCAILAHRFPNTPNYGSLTEHHTWPIEPGTVDLLVGGTPCQSFSVAGLRKGMADPRGNLALVFLGLADRVKPRWIVWENVPGVLSSNGGRDFGAFLGALEQLGYGWAYRVLDAQHVGRCGMHAQGSGWDAVPQRRRRVFVVACLGAGGWESAAKVLFEPESLCGDTAKGRKKGQGVASDAQGGAGASVSITFQPGNLRREAGAEPSTTTTTTLKASAGDQMPHVAHPVAGFKWHQGSQAGSIGYEDGIAPTITTDKSPGVIHPVVPLDGMNLLSRLGECGETHSMQNFDPNDPSFTLRKGGAQHGVLTPMAVRRLTPTECERLQGFPDGWSCIPWNGKPADQCPDGPRYKACGNSMAVPVMRWIGSRIALVEQLSNPQA